MENVYIYVIYVGAKSRMFKTLLDFSASQFSSILTLKIAKRYVS